MQYQDNSSNHHIDTVWVRALNPRRMRYGECSCSDEKCQEAINRPLCIISTAHFLLSAFLPGFQSWHPYYNQFLLVSLPAKTLVLDYILSLSFNKIAVIRTSFYLGEHKLSLKKIQIKMLYVGLGCTFGLSLSWNNSENFCSLTISNWQSSSDCTHCHSL